MKVIYTLLILLWVPSVQAFVARHLSTAITPQAQYCRILGVSAASLDEGIDERKAELVRLCTSNSPSVGALRSLINELEGLGMVDSQLLSGEWELIYAPEDETRSSPFFWAFRKAFPENADQIFGITDAIPAPIKEVGPAFQKVDLDAGTFVSRVKVATLGGFATSMMTTRAAILNDDVTNLRIKIETTKPEESSAVETLLGDLGKLVNENAPAFPSGQALEQARPGSSEVIVQNTFVDASLRISRNAERPDQDIFVWRRKSFATEDL